MLARNIQSKTRSARYSLKKVGGGIPVEPPPEDANMLREDRPGETVICKTVCPLSD